MANTQPAPQLPFVRMPYPDEILGSWLARLRIENGIGAWRTLLEHVGFGGRHTNPLFDIANYDEKLSMLLFTLGTTYERALLELTTLPYWLAFMASDSGSRLPGTTNVPMLRKIRAEGEVTSIRQLGTERQLHKSFEPRYCVKCVIQDYEEVGQPYWHRAHQLPNVFFCHKHASELQVKCGACGAKPSGQNSRILPLPTPKCLCGFQLDKAKDSRIPSTNELALIGLSVRALGQGLPDWHRGSVQAFLRAQLVRGAPSPMGRYQSVLEEAFPGTMAKATDRKNTSKEQSLLHFRRYLRTGSAPEFCGLLVALHIPYESAVAGFVGTSVERINTEILGDAENVEMTVERARAVICRTQQLYPNRPIAEDRRTFWYLQLYDLRWLRQTFPTSHNVALPSIEDDRAGLSKLLSQSLEKQSGSIGLKRARLSTEGIRASFRDRQWFEEQRSHVRREAIAQKTGRFGTVLSLRAASLQEALTRILVSEDRPTRIFASTLGAYVGLSHRQAAQAVSSSPQLRAAIAAANADRGRRLKLWAAGESLRQK